MKTLVVLALVALLSGCSSFRLGGLVYCPYGAECKFEMKK